MRDQVREYVRRHGLMRAGDRVGVAVSGGTDSVALLRVLLELREELGIVLSVIHFNHKIRGAEAEADEEFARELAADGGAQPGTAVPRELGIPFFRGEGDAPAYARERKLSLEMAARELRYGFFRELIFSGQVQRIATAHTLTDQAETVLLRLIRGAGTRGLAGVHRKIAVKKDGVPCGTIVRPMLEIRREQVEEYLRGLGQSWREDASNRDVSFARNRIRHELLPLLRRDYNPGIDQVLAETAEIARAEEEYWEQELRSYSPGARDSVRKTSGAAGRQEPGRGRSGYTGGSPGSETRATQTVLATPIVLASQTVLPVKEIRGQALAVRRRRVRAAAAGLGCALDFHHIEQVLSLLEAAPGTTARRRLELPGIEVEVAEGELLFKSKRLNKGEVSASGPYDHPLPLPGEVFIREIGRAFRASYLEGQAEKPGYNGWQFDPDTLAAGMRIRNWRAGDRYWPAHTKSPRKVKELLQERRILQPEKSLWPVVESAGEIVWVPGFAPAAKYLAQNGTGTVVVVEEVAWGEGPESSRSGPMFFSAAGYNRNKANS